MLVSIRQLHSGRIRLKGGTQALARWLLTLSVLAIVALTFVWPFALSSDPADPRFRIVAIATFVVFLGSLAALAVARLRRR